MNIHCNSTLQFTHRQSQ